MNDEQLLRYSRHVLLDGFDVAGQEALLQSTVLVIGAGGLGCPAAMYLASAGVGHLVLVDDDLVDVSNLQRQIGHTEQAIGHPKVESLRNTLLRLNPELQISSIPRRLAADELAKQIALAHVVLDCSDNFATRFLLNRLCVQQGTPLVSGAAVRAEGQLAVFDFRDRESPCYRCLYHDDVMEEETNCANNGVLAPVVGVIGSLQAMEALKLLAAYGRPSAGKLLVMDGRQGEWRQLAFKKDPQCPVCCGQVS